MNRTDVALRTRRIVKAAVGFCRSAGKEKVFCVGCNKTGTTSLKKAMADLGFVVGDQRSGELLLRHWARRDFKRIATYCRTGEFFQDIPFSLPFTCQAMDTYFPGSKFILTIRDADSWYESIRKFHRLDSIFGSNAQSLEALKEATYCYKGFAYEAMTLVYDLPSDDPHDRDTLIEHFNFHNQLVRHYFKNRPSDLLVLDVAEEAAYAKLCRFLGRPVTTEEFPWENKT